MILCALPPSLKKNKNQKGGSLNCILDLMEFKYFDDIIAKEKWEIQSFMVYDDKMPS